MKFSNSFVQEAAERLPDYTELREALKDGKRQTAEALLAFSARPLDPMVVEKLIAANNVGRLRGYNRRIIIASELLQKLTKAWVEDDVK